ncbi:hypothetical protein [Pseudogracilibacillus sp. ICA-222130]|uniref:hypothetical protein n=1 Tax=Pseudogracilibacillus sp. ICA-222130 TaxID=3134655 RepID=UPI0030BA2BE5
MFLDGYTISAEDANGIIMRTMEKDLYFETYHILDIDPTPIAESDISLEQMSKFTCNQEGNGSM